MIALLFASLASAEPLSGTFGPSDIPADVPLPTTSSDQAVSAPVERALSERLTLGDPVLVGVTDRNAYDQVIAGAAAALSECVPSGAGVFSVKVVLLAGGVVRSAEPLGEEEPAACLAGVLQGLSWPTSSGVVVATYPFIISEG